MPEIPDDWKPEDAYTSIITVKTIGNPTAIFIGAAGILLCIAGIAMIIIRWWRF